VYGNDHRLFIQKPRKNENQEGIANEIDYDELYLNFERIIEAQESSELYKKLKRPYEDFKKYFLKKNYQLRENLPKIQSEELEEECLKVAFDFLERAFKGIRTRLPSQESSIMLSDAFLLKSRSSFVKLQTLADRFTNIISETDKIEFFQELERLQFNWSEMKKRIEIDFSSNWLDVWKLREDDYPLVFRSGRALQVLPYSTASIERNFSTLGDIKTVKRNHISITNLEGYLLLKQEHKKQKIDFNPKSSEILKKKHIKETAHSNFELNDSKKDSLSKETREETFSLLQTQKSQGLQEIVKSDDRQIPNVKKESQNQLGNLIYSFLQIQNFKVKFEIWSASISSLNS